MRPDEVRALAAHGRRLLTACNINDGTKEKGKENNEINNQNIRVTKKAKRELRRVALSTASTVKKKIKSHQLKLLVLALLTNSCSRIYRGALLVKMRLKIDLNSVNRTFLTPPGSLVSAERFAQSVAAGSENPTFSAGSGSLRGRQSHGGNRLHGALPAVPRRPCPVHPPAGPGLRDHSSFLPGPHLTDVQFSRCTLAPLATRKRFHEACLHNGSQ